MSEDQEKPLQEPIQREKSVTASELRVRLESMEAGNQLLFDEILQGYQVLIEQIDARLKDSATNPQDKKQLVGTKKTYADKMRDLQQAYPEFASVKEKERQQRKIRELIEKVPEVSIRQRLQELLFSLPENLQIIHTRTLEGVLNNKDEVAVYAGTRGLLFELSRMDILFRQGLERVASQMEVKGEVEYVGFAKNSMDLAQDPNQKLKSKLQLDVPIDRNGAPYVYEAKAYPRMKYGSLPSQRNQALKYQSAIEQGLVEGATIEIKGRIDPNFLKWATGTNIADSGKIPDVEILYTFDLPSGAEYRFVLKRSRKKNGLNFQNEGRAPTPEATIQKMKVDAPDQFAELMSRFGSEEIILAQLEEDRKIINGIQRAVLDRSITDVLSTVDLKDSPPALQPHLADPMTIQSAELFEQYERLRRESIYQKLLTKRELINVDNKRSAYSEFASKEYVEKSIREYQDYLRQNPEMARIKKAYILHSEEDVQAVIAKVLTAIEQIRETEVRRIHVESDPNNHVRAERARLGYRGLSEGVALDIEHITIDAIQEVNKKKGQKGRSYENPERFQTVDALQAYLPNQDRRFLEIAIYDPVSMKTERNTDVNETHIQRTSSEILKENLKRAEARVQEIRVRFAQLDQKTDLTKEELGELRLLSGRMRAIKLQSQSIELVKTKMEKLKAEKIEALKAEKENSRKKMLATQFDERATEYMTELTQKYKETLGGEKEWDKFAKRISEKIDQNMIKFIYAVNADGEVILGEEIIRGEATGRAAHSELAQGRNVYGAGELAFHKDELGKWVLTEINNGSGHYRPSALTLPYVEHLLSAKGIDTSQVVLRDTILRGSPIRELTMLEE